MAHCDHLLCAYFHGCKALRWTWMIGAFGRYLLISGVHFKLRKSTSAISRSRRYGLQELQYLSADHCHPQRRRGVGRVLHFRCNYASFRLRIGAFSCTWLNANYLFSIGDVSVRGNLHHTGEMISSRLRAGVAGLWPDEPSSALLFQHVRCPARHSSCCKHIRKTVAGETNGLQ